jgi:hypothetical protein
LFVLLVRFVGNPLESADQTWLDDTLRSEETRYDALRLHTTALAGSGVARSGPKAVRELPHLTLPLHVISLLWTRWRRKPVA